MLGMSDIPADHQQPAAADKDPAGDLFLLQQKLSNITRNPKLQTSEEDLTGDKPLTQFVRWEQKHAEF